MLDLSGGKSFFILYIMDAFFFILKIKMMFYLKVGLFSMMGYARMAYLSIYLQGD